MYSQGYRPPQQDAKPGPQGKWYAPPPQQSPGGKKTGRSKQTPPKRTRPKRSLKSQLLKAAIVLVLMVGAGAAMHVSKTRGAVEAYSNVFLDRVSVDGIDLSGKTWAEGSQLIWDHVNQRKSGWYVRLCNSRGDANVITADMLGISFDPTAALSAAWSVGHSSQGQSLFEQQKALEQALTEEHAFYSVEQNADLSQVDAILQTLAISAYRAPQDAVFIGFDPENEKVPFLFEPEVYGRQLNVETIREQILHYVQTLESGEVLIEPEVLAPRVTQAELKAQYELRFRAVTPISKHSSADRTQNIRTAFAKINGMRLDSGKTFSFNKVVGRRSMENGFLPAVEYVYGMESLGVGGGVCQASTTVYLAAVQSGMTITKREPHSMAVSYTEYGKDATVNDTRGHEIDFTFKNETGAPIYIAAHVIQSPTNKKNLLCEVRIYGASLEGKSYVLETNIVETIPKPTEAVTVTDKKHDYVTYADETKTISGRDGYKVDAYLVTYLNGTEIARKKISSDYYREKADTIYTGTEQRGV